MKYTGLDCIVMSVDLRELMVPPKRDFVSFAASQHVIPSSVVRVVVLSIVILEDLVLLLKDLISHI
jgi:hypothetical protein